jgi:ABC-2 type transport system permease protein
MLVVARKSLLELWREPLVLALSVLLPLAFLLLYALAYTAPQLNTLRVAVVDRHPQGGRLLSELGDLRQPDGRPMFKFIALDDAEGADALLRSRQAAILMVIEPGDAADPYAITLRSDASSTAAIQAGSALDSALAEAADRLAGRAAAARIVETPLLAAAGPARSDFVVYSPGLIVFAVLTLVPSTAILLGREMRTRGLDRLRLSGLSTLEYLGGVGLAQLALGALQSMAVLAGLRLCGAPFPGPWPVVLASVLVVAASAVASGLVVGSCIHNDSQAVNVGYTVTMIQVFMCGAFFPVPAPALFSVGGHEIGLFDWLPATHGMLALQQSLLYGSGLEQTGFRLAAAAGLTGVWFAAGLILFRRRLAPASGAGAWPRR